MTWSVYAAAMAAGSSYPAVGGVTFATLCSVMADVSRQQMQSGQLPMSHAGGHDANPYAAAAAPYGIDAATWMRAQLVWGCRTMLDPNLGIEQGQTIARLMMPIMPSMPNVAGFDVEAMQMPLPPPVDPNDERLAPIEGVAMEAYVRLVATQTMYPEMTPEQATDMAVQIGFPAERWHEIHGQWSARVMAGAPASIRYAELICQILG